MAKKPISTPGGDIARRIWLAGVGAYGNAFNEAQVSLSKVSGNTSKVFDDLVAKGTLIEKTVEVKGKQVMQKVSASAPSTSLDDRIKQMRTRLGMDNAGNEGGALEARLDAIEAKLDRILAAVNPSVKPKKAKAAKKVAKKRTSVKKKASPKKKATAKKPTKSPKRKSRK